MKLRKLLLSGLLACGLLATSCSAPQGEPHDFSVGNRTFLLDGKPFVVKAAEMHYTRIPAEYWEHRIEMCKALGMNTICIYAFWNIHEQRPSEFNFANSTSRDKTTSPASAAWHRNTACTSSCGPDPTSAQSGKWADCPGGC